MANKVLNLEAGELTIVDVNALYGGDAVKVLSTLPAWFVNNVDINGNSLTWNINPPFESTFIFNVGIFEDPDVGYVTYTLTLNVADTFENIDNCCDEQVNIVWFNRVGGYQNYIFTQRKDYGVKMGKEISFINNDKIKYGEKGRVYNRKIVYASGISENEMDNISTLPYSIQAWEYKDGEFTEIYVDSQDLIKYTTKDGFLEVNISFIYSKNLRIQRQ
jgi:hypothetical protein